MWTTKKLKKNEDRLSETEKIGKLRSQRRKGACGSNMKPRRGHVISLASPRDIQTEVQFGAENYAPEVRQPDRILLSNWHIDIYGWS